VHVAVETSNSGILVSMFVSYGYLLVYAEAFPVKLDVFMHACFYVALGV
jgi:hypothetical protein